VDDILFVHHDPGAPLANLDEYFKMKEGSIQVTTFYLGSKLKKNVLPTGVVDWVMSSSKYLKYAVQNVQDYMEALPGDQKLLNKVYGPLAGGTSLSLMRVPSWTPSEKTYVSHRLELCVCVWSWE
jgi:hypothetical protein